MQRSDIPQLLRTLRDGDKESVPVIPHPDDDDRVLDLEVNELLDATPYQHIPLASELFAGATSEIDTLGISASNYSDVCGDLNGRLVSETENLEDVVAQVRARLLEPGALETLTRPAKVWLVRYADNYGDQEEIVISDEQRSLVLAGTEHVSVYKTHLDDLGWDVILDASGKLTIGCRQTTLDEFAGPRGEAMIRAEYGGPRRCECGHDTVLPEATQAALALREQAIPILREKLADLQPKPPRAPRKPAAKKATSKRATKRTTKRATKRTSR